MARVVQAPDPIPADGPLLFLGGSIDEGAAVHWQQQMIAALADTDWVILNPRRDDWNENWIQDKSDSQFRAQVEWELDGLARADHVFMYFHPGNRSPISLLELGLMVHRRQLTVCCPPGFWRKGNVDVVCDRFDIPVVTTLERAAKTLKRGLGA